MSSLKTRSGQAVRMKNRIAANQARRVAETNAKKSKISKIAFTIIVLMLGGLIGATAGINAERNSRMEGYSGEAYERGYIEAKKLWLDATVKANENTPINLNNISIPETGFVFRWYDKLYCSSTASVESDANTYTDENLCSNVSLRIDNFQYSELEKIMPNDGRLVNTGGGLWDCSTKTLDFTGKTLKECLTILRTETFSQYNEFLNDNYGIDEITKRLIVVEDANYVTE